MVAPFTGPFTSTHPFCCATPYTISTSARGEYKYLITFINDYSRYGYIYLMRHKSEALRNSNSIRQKWRTIEVRVSSLYDLIVEANTS